MRAQGHGTAPEATHKMFQPSEILRKTGFLKRLRSLNTFLQQYSDFEGRITGASSIRELEAVGIELSPYFSLLSESGKVIDPYNNRDSRLESVRQIKEVYRGRMAQLRREGRHCPDESEPLPEDYADDVPQWRREVSPQAGMAKVVDITDILEERRHQPRGVLQPRFEEDIPTYDIEGQAHPSQAAPVQKSRMPGQQESSLDSFIDHVELSNPSYRKVREDIRMVAGKSVYAAIILGEGGIGKSHLIKNELDELKKKKNEKGEKFGYVFYNGKITPMTLYEFLAKNNHEDMVIVFDDVRSLISNEDMINMLKGALWDNNGEDRTIQYNSKFPLDPGIPKKINFKSRIIFTFNKIKEDDPDIEALKSRTLYTELYLSYDEKVAAMREIAAAGYTNRKSPKRPKMTPEECMAVTDFMVQRSDEQTESFNFRTQCAIFDKYIHCRETYGPGNTMWEDLAVTSLKPNERAR